MNKNALLLSFLFLGASLSNAAVMRYQSIDHGDVSIAGNTLGLSKATDINSPGTRDSIGTFITTNLASSDTTPLSTPSWFAGTTNSWFWNASTAFLSLPAGSFILYAELVWGGSTKYVEDVTASLDVSVHLDGPSGTCGSVSPDPATAVTISDFNGIFTANYYMRSADVTACISAQGAGMYTVAGVPATQHKWTNNLNAAGWTLLVAYRNATDPLRNLTVFVDGTLVDESRQSSISITGLETPGSGGVGGHLVVAALEGDASSGGDQLRIRPAGGAYVTLSGSNNPASNFFASQINDASGNLDTSGSFGSSNHNAGSGTNITGGRQGFDITGVILSSDAGHFENNQVSADVEVRTSGDTLVTYAFGLAVDNKPLADSDNDGLPDSVEDSNGNGVVDPGETDPLDADTDDDGLSDGVEDSNGNGVIDTGETDPLDTDSDADGALDGQEDSNGNGIVDTGEADPLNYDTDNDGLSDGYEINVSGTDPSSVTTLTLNPGDMNIDGDVDLGDLLLLQRQILGL